MIMDAHATPLKRRYSLSKPPNRKRLKIQIACASCRRRKVKCDGARPVCSRCQRSKGRVECVYSQRVGEADLASQERGLSVREDSGVGDDVGVEERSGIAPDAPTTSFDHWPEHTEQYTSGSRGEIPPVGPDGLIDEGAANPMRLDSLLTEPHGVDSMNGVTGDLSRTQEVFGNSSAGSFVRQIQAAIETRLGTPHANLEPGKGAAREQSPGTQPLLSSCEEPALFLLPPRGLADALMQAYWDNNWSLYPVVNRCNIEANYESLWTARSVGNYPVIPITVINLCFAIGCHYCKLIPPRERKATGDGFFARAESLYRKTGEAQSYERVQCLLLLGIYLQSTSSVSQCWMTVGQAIRMAQSLGIHLAHSSRSRETPSHREYKRRTWHCCVWLDRVLSSTLGRPGMIPKWLFNTNPLPSMIDDEFFDTQKKGSPFRPDGRPCKMAFTVKAMELYQILDDILVDLYLRSARNEDIRNEGIERKLTQILEIDGKMQTWNRSLPEYLQTQHVVEDDSVLKRQAIVLRVRFLHARILLFRPIVISLCTRGAAYPTVQPYESNNLSLAEVMLTECSRMCFCIAHELIETFDHNLDTENLIGPLPNWWYSVLYLYNATMMILVERVLEGKNGVVAADSKAYRSWHTALRVLKCYGVLTDSATRCVAVLEILAEKLSLDHTDADPTHLANNDLGYNWDSLWAMSTPLGDEPGLSGAPLFPFTFDGFVMGDAFLDDFALAGLSSHV